MSLYFEKRELVLPGRLLAEGQYKLGENVYRVRSAVYSAIVGLAESRGVQVGVIPLKGCYVPKPGDVVIGQVVDKSPSAIFIDIGTPTQAVLPSEVREGRRGEPRHTRRPPSARGDYSLGDYIICKVIQASRNQNTVVSLHEPGLGKALKGHIMRIKPTKVPRLIGKKGSMINMIMRESGVQISVGQNGVVLLSHSESGRIRTVEKIVRKIESEAHTTGLTSRIQQTLGKIMGSTEEDTS